MPVLFRWPFSLIEGRGARAGSAPEHLARLDVQFFHVEASAAGQGDEADASGEGSNSSMSQGEPSMRSSGAWVTTPRGMSPRTSRN
jgi:hypothetical protein